MQTKKTIICGDFVYTALATVADRRDAPNVRAEKRQCTSAMRRAINQRLSWQKLEQLLLCNFARGDIFATLTYDDAHLPTNRAQARRNFQKFVRGVRQDRRTHARELRYIYNVECVHGDGRYHHHMIFNASGRDLEMLRAFWPFGLVDVIYYDPARARELAKYFAKEAADGAIPNGSRGWSPSRNIMRPTVICENVPDNLTISPPPGAVVLDNETTENQWGRFKYISYMLPTNRPVNGGNHLGL